MVKPSHMSESQNVFVVRDGVDLLRMAWGHPPEVDVEHIQKAVHSHSLGPLSPENMAPTGS